jgi:hypothetical protein
MISDEPTNPVGATTAEAPPKPATAPKTGQPSRSKAAAAARTAPASQGPTTPTAPARVRRAERRPEMIRQRREERYKQYERQRRQWFYTKIGFAVVGLLLLAAVAFLVFEWIQGQIDEAALDNVQEYGYEGSQHTATPGEPVTYTEVPPVGGTHDTVWQNCGYYEAPINNWNGVHSMEHGAVWITYRPDLPQEQVDELRELADGTSYILVSPNPDLPTPVVLSAWNHQLQLDSVDGEGFDAFIRKYRRSADAPEPQGVCSGGTSATAA